MRMLALLSLCALISGSTSTAATIFQTIEELVQVVNHTETGSLQSLPVSQQRVPNSEIGRRGPFGDDPEGGGRPKLLRLQDLRFRNIRRVVYFVVLLFVLADWWRCQRHVCPPPLSPFSGGPASARGECASPPSTPRV